MNRFLSKETLYSVAQSANVIDVIADKNLPDRYTYIDGTKSYFKNYKCSGCLEKTRDVLDQKVSTVMKL